MQPQPKVSHRVMVSPVPNLKSISPLSLVRMEQSLLQHPKLYHLSVLLPARPYEPPALPVNWLDLTNPNRKEALEALLLERFQPEGHVIGPELEVIRAALQASDDLAWLWHNGVALSILDEHGDGSMAHRAAARFMFGLAGVDMTKHPKYIATQPGYEYIGNDVFVIHTLQGLQRAYHEFKNRLEDTSILGLDLDLFDELELPTSVMFEVNDIEGQGRSISLILIRQEPEVAPVFDDNVITVNSRTEFYSAYYRYAAGLAANPENTPAPSTFRDIDEDLVSYPLSFRFGHFAQPNMPVVFTYVDAQPKTLEPA